jgi:putative Mg2+ transporter-C (MgtC) family protein
MDGAIKAIFDGTDGGMALYSLVVILISSFLGGLIGLEREFNGHAAGLRTHMIISISATLVSIIGMGQPTWAPYLIAAVIISLGFLSAGSIIQTGKDVKGITTSSTVWVTGVIGLAVGLSYVLEAIIVTIISLVVLIILSYVELKTSKRNPTITFIVDTQTDVAEQVAKISSAYGLKIHNISSKISKFKNQDALKVIVTFEKAPSETVKACGEEIQTVLIPLSYSYKVPRI